MHSQVIGYGECELGRRNSLCNGQMMRWCTLSYFGHIHSILHPHIITDRCWSLCWTGNGNDGGSHNIFMQWEIHTHLITNNPFAYSKQPEWQVLPILHMRSQQSQAGVQEVADTASRCHNLKSNRDLWDGWVGTWVSSLSLMPRIHKGEREQTLLGCPLTSGHVPWYMYTPSHTCILVHATQTLINWYNKNIQNWLVGIWPDLITKTLVNFMK